MNSAEQIYSKTYLTAKESVAKLEKEYSDKLQINYELDRKLVSFQGNKVEPIFRWFHYREGFSKQLVEYILDQLEIKQPSVLLDPFAGTGAAPFVAGSYRNMKGLAIEIMPVGAFFIECRNTFAKIDPETLIGYASKTLKSREKWIKITPTWKFNHLNITRDAFSEECQLELEQYKSWSKRQRDSNYLLFLDFVAFSILEKFSYTRKDGQYLRWDYRSPRFEKSDRKTTFNKGKIYTFYEALEEKLNNIIDDLTQNNSLTKSNTVAAHNDVHVIQGSIFEEVEQLLDKSIDIVITSPPYCNRYDYTRTYALELAYLGASEDSIRDLRQALLTCTVENKPKQFDWLSNSLLENVNEVFSKQETLQYILCYLEEEAVLGNLNNKGIKTMVKGYFYDTAIHLAQISKKMKKGAYYVMINDNVRYNGLDIPVDILLSELAFEFGFSTEKIWVLPKGKGNSSQQMKKHGRSELRKCVYIWKKI